jgi:hypothetical protein
VYLPGKESHLVDYIECSDCGVVDDYNAMQWILNTGASFCTDCRMTLVVDSHGRIRWV